MIEFLPSETEIIKKSFHDWALIRGKRYYVKRELSRVKYGELIAEAIANMVGIISAHYEAVKIDSEIYYLSEDLNSKGAFTISSQFPVHTASLYDYKKYFDIYHSRHAQSLLAQIIDIYLFDIILMHDDRNCGGWGIVQNDNEKQIVVLDSESIFRHDPRVKISSYQMPINHYRKMYPPYKPSYKDETTIKEIINFLQNFDQVFIDRFKELLDMITPEILKQVMGEIEQEYSDEITNKSYYLKMFSTHYEMLKQALNDNLSR